LEDEIKTLKRKVKQTKDVQNDIDPNSVNYLPPNANTNANAIATVSIQPISNITATATNTQFKLLTNEKKRTSSKVLPSTTAPTTSVAAPPSSTITTINEINDFDFIGNYNDNNNDMKGTNQDKNKDKMKTKEKEEIVVLTVMEEYETEEEIENIVNEEVEVSDEEDKTIVYNGEEFKNEIWYLSNDDKVKYKSIFVNADVNKTGKLQPKEAFELFIKSQLDKKNIRKNMECC